MLVHEFKTCVTCNACEIPLIIAASSSSLIEEATETHLQLRCTVFVVENVLAHFRCSETKMIASCIFLKQERLRSYDMLFSSRKVILTNPLRSVFRPVNTKINETIIFGAYLKHAKGPLLASRVSGSEQQIGSKMNIVNDALVLYISQDSWSNRKTEWRTKLLTELQIGSSGEELSSNYY